MAEDSKMKARSREYPAYTLNETIEFLKNVKDFPKDKAIGYDTVAEQIGVKSCTKSFLYKISSARQFGLITVSARTITLTANAYEILFPTKSEKELNEIKKSCFATPSIYRELIESYSGKELPNEKTLKNILVQYYGILATVSENAANVFRKTAEDVGVLAFGVLDMSNNLKTEEQDNKTVEVEEKISSKEENAVECENELKKENMGTLVVPYGIDRQAILKFPYDVTKDDVDFICQVIKMTLDKMCK